MMSSVKTVPLPISRPAVSQRSISIGASFASAAEAIWANRLRSLLTALGIIIGVAAVIAAISITQGTSALINQRVAGLGTNTLTINPGSTTTGGAQNGIGTGTTLTSDDATALASLKHVVGASPVLSITGQVVYDSQNTNTRVQGVYPSFQAIQSWEIASGGWFTDGDESVGTPVAVLGQTTAQTLFPDGTDPVGQPILIRGQPFLVVGTLQSKGATGAANQDDVIFVPFTAAQIRLRNVNYVSQIQVEVDSADNVDAAQSEATALLEQRHVIPAGGDDDFQVRNPTQLVATAQQFSQTLTLLLVSVAAISLVVGGIGIMNIMLVSVTERTREIGIRIAVGARRRDIRNQFLMEALALSGGGGLIGIGLGLIAGWWATHAFALPFAPSLISIVLAFGVSALVGIGFGLYPAISAAQMNPIEALRTD